MSLLAKRRDLNGIPSLFGGLFGDDRWFGSDILDGWKSNAPAANVQETENEFRIELAAPGMEKKDFHIDVQNGTICISSEKEQESQDEQNGYTRKEFSYNSFSRSFLLPDSVNEEKIKASYKDGVLSLTLPKRDEVKKLPKKEIKIS